MKNQAPVFTPPSSQLLSVLEYFQMPAIILSVDYHIVAANAAYRRLYGEEPAAKHRYCYEVSHGYRVPCDQAGETCPLKNAIATGHSQRVLHLHHTPHGEEHVDVETFPIKDSSGNIIYLIELLRATKSASSQPLESGLVGRSPRFNKMVELIQRVASSDINVLLLGESGTGKELVAQAIHEGGSQAKAALVPLECSGLSESLFESELFGHEKGAFTGASNSKPGLVETAIGGTLFLDEVGDIPLSLQVKLLRLLETGTYRRVGCPDPRKADFRLICATHRDLKAMVKSGEFRQDLYYRISSFPIHLPPLRDRVEDIPLLVEALLTRIHGDSPPAVDAQALQLLKTHEYHGNIRELRNVLEWAHLMANGEMIRAEHLPDEFQDQQNVPKRDSPVSWQGEIISLDKMEKNYLRWVLVHYSGDKRSLAKQLGISERTLYRKIEQSGN
ncbi:MAG: sigma-54-dependent Fis family transcriptional regulator [Gammaproteobacteria bacterium]|nr:sigma-54-dependent Fis family transcriptional regulator [Gammaproteobacteria bacterium]